MGKNIKFQFEGNLYDINVTRNGNILSIEHEGQNYVVSIADQFGGAPVTVASPVPVAAPAPAAPVAAPVSSAPAVTEKASMAGTIKEIKVNQGSTVKSGDLLLVMEAMKMDIEVFATHNGTVSAIHVTAGANVAEGQALVDIA